MCTKYACILYINVCARFNKPRYGALFLFFLGASQQERRKIYILFYCIYTYTVITVVLRQNNVYNYKLSTVSTMCSAWSEMNMYIF
jgi:hypothetical protein